MLVFFVILALTSESLCDTGCSTPVCGENEIVMDCRTSCPPQFCNNSYTSYAPCDPKPKCEPGCDCIKDYLRDNNGRCVFNENCPPPSSVPECGEFEEPSECGIIYSQQHDPAIDLYSKCRRCKCIDKYVRDSYGACVPIPPAIACGQNEEASICKKVCPPLSCDWDPEKEACKPGPCQPGCNCVYGHLRDEYGNCIPEEQCSKYPDEDESDDVLIIINVFPVYKIPSGGSSKTIISTIPCKTPETGETPCIYDQCTPTCSIPNPPNCPQISAVKTNRCNCDDGYILSEKGGQCITIQECQSRNTCRQNETFVSCSFQCPSTNCPENDDRPMVACGLPYPCPPGCACKPYYKRISYTDDRCILASDCPPVKCTRQNEVWNSCPPPCFTDRCRDLKQTPEQCYRNGLECEPQCVCQENYCRNDSEICVPIPGFRFIHTEYSDEDDESDDVLIIINVLPVYKIPSGGSSKTIISAMPCKTPETGETPCIYDQCTPTCSIPNPPNCPQISAVKTNRCNCADGYILSEKGGQCITIQECQSRNTCRQNETFVNCNFGCPTNNCPENDNRATVACDLPYPCPPGCACKPYYKRISYTDDRCVLASDCPPVKCTRQYEVWNSCPPPCFTDRCRDLKQTPEQCYRFGLECQPQCVCQQNYCRNDSEICVPVPGFPAE